MPDDLSHRLPALAKAVEDALVAHHGLRSALKADHPPFWKVRGDLSRDDWEKASIADALKHYGGPGPLFDLWCACRAMETLRRVWTGKEA